MRDGLIGCITTPKQGNTVPTGAYWCADNGKYGKGWPGDVEWFCWLADRVRRYDASRCLFATAPDVVGDPIATLLESYGWLDAVRSLGVPVAFVAQDGCEAPGLVPWGQFDVLFLGGSTDWKLGPARDLVGIAHLFDVPVHMGRVNSRRRMLTANEWGCASADGTFIAFGPDKNLPIVLSWLQEVNS